LRDRKEYVSRVLAGRPHKLILIRPHYSTSSVERLQRSMAEASDIVFGGTSFFSEALQILDLIQRSRHGLDDESHDMLQSSRLLEELGVWSRELAQSSHWNRPAAGRLRSIRDILERAHALVKEASQLHEEYESAQTKASLWTAEWNASDYTKFNCLLQDVEHCIKEFKRNADQIAGIDQTHCVCNEGNFDAVTEEDILKQSTGIRNEMSFVRRRLACLGLKKVPGSYREATELSTTNVCDGDLPGMGSWTSNEQDSVVGREE